MEEDDHRKSYVKPQQISPQVGKNEDRSECIIVGKKGFDRWARKKRHLPSTLSLYILSRLRSNQNQK